MASWLSRLMETSYVSHLRSPLLKLRLMNALTLLSKASNKLARFYRAIFARGLECINDFNKLFHQQFVVFHLCFTYQYLAISKRMVDMQFPSDA
mmetsp:Transcript_11283/g.27737  ORF Transcript_11283/g.27737 Transcript_11283/m.27737 type:complete len:94 (+) Transcript_11283:1424-1705(+)